MHDVAVSGGLAEPPLPAAAPIADAAWTRIVDEHAPAAQCLESRRRIIADILHDPDYFVP
jgi:hypothetical protein